MKLTFTTSSLKKGTTRLVEWGVFLGVCGMLVWCLWFYYDTNRQFQEIATVDLESEEVVNETNLQRISDVQVERREQFSQPFVLTKDPFGK